MLSAQWKPALSHPECWAIIDALLSDWFVNQMQPGSEVLHIYDHPPNLKAVRIDRSRMPDSRLPSVDGVQFVAVEGAGNEPFWGTKPGHIGIRFEVFDTSRPDRVRVVFCLLQFEDRNRIGGWSIAYTVEKSEGRWKRTFQGAST